MQLLEAEFVPAPTDRTSAPWTVVEKPAVQFVVEQRDPEFVAGFSPAACSSFQSFAAPADP